MKSLYKDVLLDHYRNPRNKGMLPEPDFESADAIPSCGDSVSMQGTIENNSIKKVMFQGSGCVISQATASLLAQKVSGKTLDQVLAISAEDIQDMIHMQLGPVRLKCALLPLYVLQQGVKQYQIKSKKI